MTRFKIEDDFYLDGEPFKILSGAIHYFRILKKTGIIHCTISRLQVLTLLKHMSLGIYMSQLKETSILKAILILKNKIISGQFASGDKFYTEAELIAMYDVSSITVVRALNDLAKDGYIVRQQGKGPLQLALASTKLVEFSDVEIFETKDDKVTVLSIERGNDLNYLEKLGLRGDQFLLQNRTYP